MENEINKRLALLRDLMRQEHLSAFIFPSTDPHNGEYVPEHWEGRKWISGFDGSAGTAVVTMDRAALWTDSRYFLAAEKQLAGTEYELMKERIPGTPSISGWLGMVLAQYGSPEVGIDGSVCCFSEVEKLRAELRNEGGITLRTNLDPLQRIWNDRPSLPQNPIEIQLLQYAGERCADKINRLRKKLASVHVCGTIVSALDDIAWLLNLRGSDVHCNPVFVSYLIVTSRDATLFVKKAKLSQNVVEYLAEEGVRVDDYDKVGTALHSTYQEYNILLDPNQLNYTLYKKVDGPVILNGVCPVAEMKAVKNQAEIAGFRNAMLRDGVALVKFLRWLKPAVAEGGQTEMSIDQKLTALRADQPLFRGVSFDTIAGYQSHGAIVHYEAIPATDALLKSEGFLLIDSGAQYQDGTTDITRTIPLGPVTDEQRRIYTLVLKGHIKLEMLKFPYGASGTQLDAVARMDMWKEGLNFLHGTGHGVGSYLNVHEGPHQIRMEWKPAPLFPGMTVTDEPGLYLSGKFGVRIENTLLIKDYKETDFGRFLQFEPLTLCPIDTEPIIVEMLSDEELAWLNDYHLHVKKQLLPLLENADDRIWLEEHTQPLGR